ncbi:MAG TPA: DedA family protein, partial [Bacteroidota bacterium]
MEHLIQYLLQTNAIWIYLFVCLVAYVENIFPPFPSDVAVVAVGSLTGLGTVNFPLTLLCCTAGSTLGFISMFKVGDWFGQKILERGKMRFIPLDQVHKVEGWFHKYGYWVVVGNRFLSGTRAVVSFFAG